MSEQYSPETERKSGKKKWVFLAFFVLLLLTMIFLTFWWGREPGQFDVRATSGIQTQAGSGAKVTGFVTTSTLIEIVNKLLDKPGGYLSNDIMPPSIFMDNIPNWEFGVLVQVRDFTKVLRNDISRSQSQSRENPALARAEPKFNVDSKKWVFPQAEGQYREGALALQRYLFALSDTKRTDTQFFSRADNLTDWLKVVSNRLGSLSQRLSASVGQVRINTNTAGDPDAQSSTREPEFIEEKTPWLQIDDVFYEARGTCWALIHLLRAIKIDFAPVLEKKNATRSLEQIIRELESTQRTIWSPIVLNGSDFGFFANYSLVMSSYISRANAGIIELRDLLTNG